MHSSYIFIFFSLATNYSKVLAINFQKEYSLATEIVDNSSYSRWVLTATESQPLLTASDQQAIATVTASINILATTITTIVIPRNENAAIEIPKTTPSPGIAQNSIQRYSIKDLFSCTIVSIDEKPQRVCSFGTKPITNLKDPTKQITATAITSKSKQKSSISAPSKKRRNFINLGPLSPSSSAATSETPPPLPTLTTILTFLAPTRSTGIAAKSVNLAATENTVGSLYVPSCDKSAPSAILTSPIKIMQRPTQTVSINQPASLLARPCVSE